MDDGKPLFAWVHVSDIYRGERGGDRRLLLGELRSDIIRAVSDGDVPRPDAILVAGNAASTASEREYDDARQWLLELSGALGLKGNRMFLVPGDKDIDPDWSKDASVWRLVRDLQHPKHARDAMNAVLADKRERGRLGQRLANYLRFSRMVMPECSAPSDHRLFWYHRIRTSSGLVVRLVGINTALLVGRAELTDEDKRERLYLGEAQAGFALSPAPGDVGDLAVVLSHRSVDDDSILDRSNVGAWVRRHAHVQIFGSSGDVVGSTYAGSGTRAVQIGAGQRDTGEGDYVYRVAWVVLRHDRTLGLRVWPRKWSPKNKDFRQDQDVLGEGRSWVEYDIHGDWSQRTTVPYRRDEKRVSVACRAARTPAPEKGDGAYLVTFERDGKPVAVEWFVGNTLVDSYETGELSAEVRRRLLADAKRAEYGVYVMQKEPRLVQSALDCKFDVTLEFGRVTVRQDGGQVAEGEWRDGHIVGMDALFVSEEDTEKIYRRIERQLVRLCGR
jgi:hypothetical protein